ncbi:polyketide cyclase [Halobacteriales archaeon SW_10_66_29]|nr:MAG: polyketide cyclase [Halobacteriales archaeon SW_10_66_29]
MSLSGRRLVVSQYVPADRGTVWELLTDTERWPDWGPTVTGVESEDRGIRAGTTGRVQLPIGLWLPFEVTSYGEHRWTWDVARIPATGHRVEREGEGCRVGFELPLYAAGYALVCRRALARIETLATEP